MLKQCFDFEVTEDRRIFPVIVCLGLLFVWAAFRLLPAEDAVILYDYSKNLARSGVITYSTNTTPIEGATDFLWMLLISLGSFCGLDEFISAQILSFLGVSGLFYLLYQAGLPLALFALSFVLTPYLYATLFGFSALFFVFFYVLALYFAKTAHRYFYWSLLILSLLSLWPCPSQRMIRRPAQRSVTIDTALIAQCFVQRNINCAQQTFV